MHRVRAVGVWWAVCLLVCGVARAQSDPKVEATRLSDEGAEELRQHRYPSALDRFEAAQRLFPSANLAYNLGLALDGLGRAAEAASAFARFLREAREAPAAQRGYAERRLAALELLCARVRITAEPPGARLQLDDRPVAPSEAVHVATGTHVATAELGGYVSGRRSFEASAGQLAEISLRLEAIPVAARPPVGATASMAVQAQIEKPRKTPLHRRWWLWTIVAGAVIAGAVTAAAVVSTQPPAKLVGSLGEVTPRF